LQSTDRIQLSYTELQITGCEELYLRKRMEGNYN